MVWVDRLLLPHFSHKTLMVSSCENPLVLMIISVVYLGNGEGYSCARWGSTACNHFINNRATTINEDLNQKTRRKTKTTGMLGHHCSPSTNFCARVHRQSVGLIVLTPGQCHIYAIKQSDGSSKAKTHQQLYLHFTTIINSDQGHGQAWLRTGDYGEAWLIKYRIS